MADIRPLRGLRYDPARVEMGAVVCPPYDVISSAEQKAYHARDPHNIIRVELGLGSADSRLPGNRYTAASEALALWQQEGVLKQEDVPAVYLYEHQFTLGQRTLTRRGLLVAGRLHDWSEGIVLPHEGTRAGPKADRLALLQATQTNVSPLWLLYDAAGVAPALAPTWEAEPVARAESAGERHTLRVVTDAARLRTIVDAFRERPLYIADGHHRYETAQFYRDEQRRASGAAGEALPSAGREETDRPGAADRPPGPTSAAGNPDAGYEFVLMLLVALDDPGLVVLPTHRLVRHGERSLPSVHEALARWLTLSPIPLPAGDDTATAALLERELAVAGRQGPGQEHAFALFEAGGAWLLRPRADALWQALLPPDRSPAWQRLDVAVLDALAIRHACGITAEDEAAHTQTGAALAADRLTYVSDLAGALGAVRSGAAQQAYLLNPTRVEQVCAVAAAGDRMPPKSTFFFPKPVTGLVLHPLYGTRPYP